jgi:hypothetical protein
MALCTTAAGPHQSGHSRVRDPQDSWPYFTVSYLRLPNFGQPDPYIYMPQKQDSTVTPPGTERLQTLMSKSDGQPASLSWYQAPIWDHDRTPITVRKLRVCWCGALCLTRERVCSLQFCWASPALSFFWSESRRTHLNNAISFWVCCKLAVDIPSGCRILQLSRHNIKQFTLMHWELHNLLRFCYVVLFTTLFMKNCRLKWTSCSINEHWLIMGVLITNGQTRNCKLQQWCKLKRTESSGPKLLVLLNTFANENRYFLYRDLSCTYTEILPPEPNSIPFGCRHILIVWRWSPYASLFCHSLRGSRLLQLPIPQIHKRKLQRSQTRTN